ncbi:hypothetical protein, partial [Pokkaliibacter plantistimulans]|uniref:hypothetical protein n=1 Tax=Pokkaliibacter plantistimulans TaxID=1635171 RepID=UPI002D775E07
MYPINNVGCGERSEPHHLDANAHFKALALRCGSYLTTPYSRPIYTGNNTTHPINNVGCGERSEPHHL